jgi:hypothetical protein
MAGAPRYHIAPLRAQTCAVTTNQPACHTSFI